MADIDEGGIGIVAAVTRTCPSHSKSVNNCAVLWVGQRIQLLKHTVESWAYTFPILSCHMNVENTYRRSFAHAGVASMAKS